MNAVAMAVPRSMVEEKATGIAWHYRLADENAAADGIALLHELAKPLCLRHDIEVLLGAKVIELRPRGVHKGHVVRELVREHAADTFVVAIGDDVTDDDMFGALPPGAFAIAAAVRPRAAHFRVEGHRVVRSFLQRLCEEPSSCSRLRQADG
jgi:trehalose 6-phosphate synthase/phosphatase